MSAFVYECFELLKEKVLEHAKIHFITTGECNYLSGLIYSKTKKSISETTLKRVYGFASSRFKPSSFTLNAMSQFCDYQNWDEFCQQNKPGIAEQTNPVEKSLFERAENISRNTLQALKNRSGVPYYYTVDRKAINEHLSIFEEEDYTATFLIGPTGSGKTISLLHWVEERMAFNPASSNRDVFIFFSSHLLNSAMLHENSLEKWLLSMYGIHTNYDLSGYFAENNVRLFFIIDGFDEHHFKPDQFETIFNQLIDIVSVYKDSKWFKLIITMSSATWTNNMVRIQNFHMIRDKWYFGTLCTADSADHNISPFTYEELARLSEKINPKAPVPPTLEHCVLHFLSHPEYFTYFYYANRQNFSLYNAQSARLHTLLSTYILEKVYSGRNRAEKVALIETITSQVNWQKHTAYVSRNAVQPTIRQYIQAYRELVGHSILAETNHSSILRYKELVQFGNNHLARYFLTEKMLKEHNDEITYQLIHDAQFVTIGEDDYLGVLKWLLFHAINRKDFKVLTYLTALKFHPTEKVTLARFICDHLVQNFDSLNNDPAFSAFVEKDFVFFNAFFKLPFINSDYKKSITSLLQFNLPVDKVILIRSLLAFAGIMEADLNTTAKHLQEMRLMPEDAFDRLPVNPVDAITTILVFLKQGKIQTATFSQVTSILFDPEKLTKNKQVFETYFRIVSYTLLLTLNYRKMMGFIKLVRKALPKMNGSISMELSLWLSIIECRTALLNHDTRLAESLYKYLTNRYQHQYGNFTEVMRLTYLLLKIKAVVFLKIPDDLTIIEKQICRLAASSGFIMFDILSKAYLINLHTETSLTDAEVRSLNTSLIKLANLKGLRFQTFGTLYAIEKPLRKLKSQA